MKNKTIAERYIEEHANGTGDFVKWLQQQPENTQPSTEWQLITILRKLQEFGYKEHYSDRIKVMDRIIEIENHKFRLYVHSSGFCDLVIYDLFETAKISEDITVDEALSKLKQLLSKEGGDES